MNGAATVQTLQRLAAEMGYRLDTLEKVLRLLELLDEIAQDSVLSQRLALKGGTALSVFYLDLDRLSVDIDLNRGAHRGHADACLEVQARSQASGPRVVREGWWMTWSVPSRPMVAMQPLIAKSSDRNRTRASTSASIASRRSSMSDSPSRVSHRRKWKPI